MAVGEVFQRFRDFWKEFDVMILNVLAKLMTWACKFRSDRRRTEFLEGVDESVREAVQAVSVLHDAFALDVVQDFANLLRRENS